MGHRMDLQSWVSSRHDFMHLKSLGLHFAFEIAAQTLGTETFIYE